MNIDKKNKITSKRIPAPAENDTSKRMPAPAEKITSKPMPATVPLPVVMVSCGDMDNSNIITIAWTGIVNSDPPMTYVSVRKERYSHELISKSGEFVINVVHDELARACDWCGVKSGRDYDKFEKMNLTKMPGDKVKAPLIKESKINIECKVTQVIELPSHDMFLAEIVSVHLDNDIVEQNGAYSLDKMTLVAYNHGHYYRVGRKPIGRFGYSVMKPKTLKRIRREARSRK